MFATVVDGTTLVAIGTVVEVDPTAISTVGGTVAEALLLERFTTTPPTGAAWLSVIVPVAP